MNEFVFFFAVFVFNDDGLTVGFDNFAGAFSYDELGGVFGDFAFYTGTDNWGLGFKQRNSLFLHGAGHEGAVNAVLLYERNK